MHVIARMKKERASCRADNHVRVAMHAISMNIKRATNLNVKVCLIDMLYWSPFLVWSSRVIVWIYALLERGWMQR